MSSNNSNGGIGFCGMLGILFIGLKLGGIIDWSWWWVTAPLWGGFALVVALLSLVGLGALVVESRKVRR